MNRRSFMKLISVVVTGVSLGVCEAIPIEKEYNFRLYTTLHNDKYNYDTKCIYATNDWDDLNKFAYNYNHDGVHPYNRVFLVRARLLRRK